MLAEGPGSACILQGEQQWPRTIALLRDVDPTRKRRKITVDQRFFPELSNDANRPSGKNKFLCKPLCQLVVMVQATIPWFILHELKVLSICPFTHVHMCRDMCTEVRRLLPGVISLFPLLFPENKLNFSGLGGKGFCPLSPKTFKNTFSVCWWW